MGAVPLPKLPETISAFAETHCTTCTAGWARTDADGKKVIFCLLDAEPVWADMVDCDRYEKRSSGKY